MFIPVSNLRPSESREQKEKLKQTLTSLCHKSEWKNAGRPDLVTNTSSLILTDTQKEALSLGLKFATGINKKRYLDYILKNTRWRDNDIDKGFKQGLILGCTVAAEAERPAIPRRYIKTLQDLKNNKDITITSADKGGGIVIMNTDDYNKKMEDLLADTNTYKQQKEGKGEEESKKFNKEASRILKKSDKGKKLLHMLDETPKTPTMRDSPKTHKPGVPLRPITSGIGNAPHKLAKCLARPLSSALGQISNTHLNNSSDLKERIEEVNMKNKVIVSFDVKALFTNVPVEGTLKTVEKVLENIDDSELPVNKSNYM